MIISDNQRLHLTSRGGGNTSLLLYPNIFCPIFIQMFALFALLCPFATGNMSLFHVSWPRQAVLCKSVHALSACRRSLSPFWPRSSPASSSSSSSSFVIVVCNVNLAPFYLFLPPFHPAPPLHQPTYIIRILVSTFTLLH